MLRHVVPQLDGRAVPPPIVHLSTSFYELNDSTEESVLSHLEAIRGLGFEYFWLDAYWTRDGFPNGMGNYGFPLERAEPPDRFPHGLKPIGDAAREAGMGFVVWFEPERVASNTHLAREHPEWVISPAGDGSGLCNLGDPEARQYITDYLIAAIQQYGITGLRIDFNIGPLPFWQHLDQQDPGRVGLAEIRYVEGLYRMWDDIRAACPGLFIDNCASGGMRVDLETCSRSIPLWRTDATIGPLMNHDFDQAALHQIPKRACLRCQEKLAPVQIDRGTIRDRHGPGGRVPGNHDRLAGSVSGFDRSDEAGLVRHSGRLPDGDEYFRRSLGMCRGDPGQQQ